MRISFDSHATKAWLVRALDPISDAEPALLADFILALLTNDVADVHELRKNCVDQLVDFLEDNTGPFVDSLFHYLEAPHDAAAPLPYGNSRAEVVPPMPIGPASSSAAAAARDRKRPRSPQPMSHPQHQQPYKQPRITPNPFLFPPPAGMGFPGAPGFNGPSPPPGAPAGPQKQPCRDYHFRGYCPRGAACPFQHDAMLPSGLPAAPMSANMQPPPPNRGGPRRPPQDRPAAPPRNRPGRGETRCVRVENIPVACATEAAVRQFFSPFGKIAGLSANKNTCTALVAFSTPGEAERALSSPQPIFGNRFVRTYRTQEDPELLAAGQVASNGEDASMADVGAETPTAGGAPASAPTAASSEAAAEAAAAAAAVKARAAERAQQLEANSARQKEVLANLDGADKEQKKVLLREMRSLTAEAEQLLREAKEAAAAPAGPEDARARLERLRREANALGLGSTPAGKPPRKFARPERDPKRFKLDLRSKRVLAESVNEAGLEELQKHFEAYGSVRTLGAKEGQSAYSFEFDSREAAEQALAAGAPTIGGEQVQLRWDSDAQPNGSPAA